MKDFFAKSSILLVILFVIVAGLNTSEAKDPQVIGTWDYSAPNAPYEYSKGQIIIAKKGDELEGKVSIDGYDMKLNNIKIDKDLLSFSLYVEGEYVSVKLTIKKDAFSGTADTPEGTIELTGEKSK